MPVKFRCELLCEDSAQEQFFRPILERLFRRVRVSPRRTTGGFTFVLEQAVRSAAYISRYRQEAVGLLIVIDGDPHGQAQRRQQIVERLAAKGLDFKLLRENLGICVPTRNVETWMLWFQGRRDLDEVTDYKHRVDRAIRPSEIFKWWLGELSAEEQEVERKRLPALADGRKEIDRLAQKAHRSS